MPLTNNVSKNISELTKDNKKSGKSRGANGKVRSRRQIIAIALNAAGKSNKSKRKKYDMYGRTRKSVFKIK